MKKKGFVFRRFGFSLGNSKENEKVLDRITGLFGYKVDQGYFSFPSDFEIANGLMNAETLERVQKRPVGSVDRNRLYSPLVVFENGTCVQFIKTTDDGVMLLFYIIDVADAEEFKAISDDFIMCAGSDWKNGDEFTKEKLFMFTGNNYLELPEELIVELYKETLNTEKV